MPAERITLEQVTAEAEFLSPVDRLHLIKSVAEMLISRPMHPSSKQLVYGEFKGARLSTEEDFAVAEWRPSERELDGP